MLTDKERELLSGKNFVHVATLNADGSPQVSPVWVDLEGDLIRINTEKARVKARNLARDPRVALSVHDEKDPNTHAAIRGEVVEMTEDGAVDHINALSRKYLGKPYPWLSDGDQRVIVKIKKVER